MEKINGKNVLLEKMLEQDFLDNDEEVVSLVLEYQTNNNFSARNKIILSFQKFVAKIASKYVNSCDILDFEDLVSAGNLGLFEAIKRFETGYDAKFSTYARWWIFQSIVRLVTESQRPVSYSSNLEALFVRYKRAINKFSKMYPRFKADIVIKEIEGSKKINRRHIEKMRMMDQKTLSLDYPNPINSGPDDVGSSSDFLLSEILLNQDTPEDISLANLEKIKIKNFLGKLSPRDRSVIELRFGFVDGDSWTLQKIGDKLDISRERVRQIEENSLKKLREIILR